MFFKDDSVGGCLDPKTCPLNDPRSEKYTPWHGGRDGFGNVKPDVINLGPVTKEQIDAVRTLRQVKPVDHPKPVEQLEWTPAAIQEKLVEAGMIPDPTDKSVTPSDNLVISKGDTTISGILFAYIDVGTLSPVKAEAFVGRLKNQMKPALSRLPDHVAVIFVPTRGRATGFEFMPIPKA